MRAYSKTCGDNIWTSGDYEITRHGSRYWGFTDYFVTFKGKQIASTDSWAEAIKAAREHKDEGGKK
jgi:hypothetical protein